MLLAKEISGRNAVFEKQRQALDASEYLLYKLAPVEQNAVRYHEINESKVGEIDCSSLGKEILIDNPYFSLNGKQCGSRENKTVVKRIALCGGNVCMFEVGA